MIIFKPTHDHDLWTVVYWEKDKWVTLQDLTQDGQYSNSEYNLSGVQLTVNKSSQALNVSLS